jgi:LPPG:FO 2-phospho-L-lactate transferase
MWAALAGGVGGAKLARGLAVAAEEQQQELRIIANTGDDSVLHGLHISPDIDTLLYTLSGIADPQNGWGIAGDTFNVMSQLDRLGQETWFKLGDRDIATHITRTRWLAEGMTLTEVTRRLAQRLGVPAHIDIIPMTDDSVATYVETSDGWLPFQEYFVHRHHADPVRSVRFQGIEHAHTSPLVVDTILRAEYIIFCPSNPIVSIGPILDLPDVRAMLRHRQGKNLRIAVSPIIGGQALRGPADRMLEGLGYEASARSVAELYTGLIDILVLDKVDAALAPAIEQFGIRPLIVPTVMQSLDDSVMLARAIIQAAMA